MLALLARSGGCGARRTVRARSAFTGAGSAGGSALVNSIASILRAPANALMAVSAGARAASSRGLSRAARAPPRTRP
jgi:hypothetical protein